MGRTAVRDRAWARKELDKKNAYIQKLEAENEQLRRTNRTIERERDEIIRLYTNLIKQSRHCRRSLERLNANDISLPAAPTETEISRTRNTKSPLVRNPRDRYQDNVPTASLTTGSVRSNSNGSAMFTDVTLYPNTLHSPASSSEDLSSVCTPGHASSISGGLPKDGKSDKRASSLALRHVQTAPPEQNPYSIDQLAQSRLTQRKNEEALNKVGLQATTQLQHGRVGHGRRFSSGASSDVSMESVSDRRAGGGGAAEVDPEDLSSADSSDSSSSASDEDSDEQSDEDPATSVDASVEARKDTDSENAGREGSRVQPGDLQYPPVSRHNEVVFERNPPTLQHRNRSSGRGSNSHQLSTEARPTTSDSGSPKTRSTRAREASLASMSLKPSAPHTSTTFGSRSPATLGSGIRDRPSRMTSPVTAPATARHGEEETDSDLKTAIRESYAKFGLSGHQLRFCCEPQTLDPTAINLNTNWKRRCKLNESVTEKLLQMGSEIMASLPQLETEKAIKKEVDLIRRLSNCNRTQVACGSLREVVRALRHERDVAKDELNLIEFEIYSTLIIMKYQNEGEFEETIRTFSDYQCNLLGMYNSLHMFLAHLNQAWHGLHLLVLIYMLRVGTGRLVKYLVPTTRPAAIELLLQKFEKPELIAKNRKRLHHLVSLSGPACTTYIQEVTPLSRLQDRMVGVVEPSIVRSALGYGPQYQNGAGLNLPKRLFSTSKAIPNHPHSLNASSERHDPYDNLHDESPVHSTLQNSLQNIETSRLTAMTERPGPRKNIYVDYNEEEAEENNRPASKRRCGIDRVNEYDTGSAVNNAETPFSEDYHEVTGIRSSVDLMEQTEQESGTETQGDSGYGASNHDATEAVGDLRTNLHIATDRGAPWLQKTPVSIDGYVQMQSTSQATIERNYSTAATRQSPNFNLYEPWRPNVPQQGSSAGRVEPIKHPIHWNSSLAPLPQEVIDSVEDGTVDPRVLELRS